MSLFPQGNCIHIQVLELKINLFSSKELDLLKVSDY